MATDPRDSVGIVKDPFDAAGSAQAPVTPLPVSIASLASVTPVAGCTYPDTWSAIGSPVPGVCTETPSR
ncbi:hypothetical protein B0H13DRAFT_2375158 [Mycena leptocephala]|nr:hypothetical protein B0H13DRAFT_2375158 [Mycena leptocephala]